MERKKTPPAYGDSPLSPQGSGPEQHISERFAYRTHNCGLPLEHIVLAGRTGTAGGRWVTSEINQFLVSQSRYSVSRLLGTDRKPGVTLLIRFKAMS